MPRRKADKCPAGHEYSEENTTIYSRGKRGGTYRQCKICKNTRNKIIRRRVLTCPYCGKETRPRDGVVMEGVPRAVLKDGTCDLCWQKEIRGAVKRAAEGIPSREEREVTAARESLQSYFRSRRSRGVDPAGNADLDAAFERDTGWTKRQRAEATRRRHKKEREEMTMEAQEFARYLERDGGRCMHCGTDQGLVPQHRQNRGMGGSPLRNVPSNIIVLCSEANGLMESSATWAQRARDYGWKVSRGEDPFQTPVFDYSANRWYMLRDDFARIEVPAPQEWAVS